jgi:hypothetical protein
MLPVNSTSSVAAAIAATPAASSAADRRRVARRGRSADKGRPNRGNATRAPAATRAATVPLPEAEVPSMATTGTGCVIAAKTVEIVGKGLGDGLRVVDPQRRARAASDKHMAMR